MNIDYNLELVSNPKAILSANMLGKTCIDHVLDSSSIAAKISSIKYLEYPEECYTYHTSIMITLKLNKPTGIPPIWRRHHRLYSKDQQNTDIHRKQA
jgi:hypothetical protein